MPVIKKPKNRQTNLKYIQFNFNTFYLKILSLVYSIWKLFDLNYFRSWFRVFFYFPTPPPFYIFRYFLWTFHDKILNNKKGEKTTRAFLILLSYIQRKPNSMQNLKPNLQPRCLRFQFTGKIVDVKLRKWHSNANEKNFTRVVTCVMTLICLSLSELREWFLGNPFRIKK